MKITYISVRKWGHHSLPKDEIQCPCRSVCRELWPVHSTCQCIWVTVPLLLWCRVLPRVLQRDSSSHCRSPTLSVRHIIVLAPQWEPRVSSYTNRTHVVRYWPSLDFGRRPPARPWRGPDNLFLTKWTLGMDVLVSHRPLNVTPVNSGRAKMVYSFVVYYN